MLESGGGNLKLESEQAAGAPASEQDASAPEGSPSSSEAEAAAKEERGTPCMEQPFMLGLCCKNVLYSVLVRLIFATFSGKQAAPLTTHHSLTHHSLTTHHSPPPPPGQMIEGLTTPFMLLFWRDKYEVSPILLRPPSPRLCNAMPLTAAVPLFVCACR